MANDTGFFMDFKDFEKKFIDLVMKAILQAGGRGLFQGFNAMLKDADTETPKTPFKEGHLRGSKKVTKVKIEGGEIIVEGGFNISCAVKLHEMEKSKADKVSWTLPGSGPKFLEKKLVTNKRKYMEIVASSIKKAGK